MLTLDRFRDRRRSQRRAANIPFRFRVRDSETAPDWENLPERARCENVSDGGIFFTTELQLALGARVDLLIERQVENDGPARACVGHVTRVDPMPQGNRGVGIEFDWYSTSRLPIGGWDKLSISPVLPQPEI